MDRGAADASEKQIGAFGYPLYVTGLLLFDRYDILALPVLGGVALGFGAAQLWAGVNYIALAYADENEKGMLAPAFCAVMMGLTSKRSILRNAGHHAGVWQFGRIMPCARYQCQRRQQ